MSKKQTILNTISDLVSDLLYYDREGDEELGVGAIDYAVRSGLITIDEMVDHFREELNDRLQP